MLHVCRLTTGTEHLVACRHVRVLSASCMDLRRKDETHAKSVSAPTDRDMGLNHLYDRLTAAEHRENQGYTSFDDFLMALKQSKRKNIRQERKHVAASGLRLERLRGSDLKPAVWDTFYRFYRNTTGAALSPPADHAEVWNACAFLPDPEADRGIMRCAVIMHSVRHPLCWCRCQQQPLES